MASDKTISLIEKILNNSASEAEIEEFNTWVGESDDNKIFYNQLKAIWYRLGNTSNITEYNEEAVKENIILRILQNQTTARKQITRFWISVAASVLIIIGIGSVILFTDHNTESLVYSTINDEVLNIMLPDSSKVWLNENSHLRVAKKFNTRDRKVILNGEAYFEVTRNEEKVFKVIAGRTTTKVLGTSFNLKSDENKNVQLIVNYGKVTFYNRFSVRNKEIYTAGEKGEYLSSKGIILREENNDLNYISWKTGVLTFYDAPLDEVCNALTTHYKVNIKSKVVNTEITITCTFNNDNLDDILSTIAITLDLEIKKSKNGVIIIQSKNH